MKNKNLLIGFLLIGALSMLIMSIHYFIGEDSGILKGKMVKDIWWYRLSFLSHITFGLIAILTGPFQFISQLIQRQPSIHRRIGYVYCFAVLSSSLTGLVIAQFAMGGMITRVGFSTLSVIWFFSLLMALRKVYAKNIEAHSRWMSINYALTFSAITQRTILLLAFLPFFSFMPIYQLSAWLSWIFNLGLVLVFLNKR